VEESIRRYEQALRLDPGFAFAYGALGEALLARGRWAEARDATRRWLDLLPPRDPRRGFAAQQLRRCERLLGLGTRLPVVLRRQDRPAGAAECLEFAAVCVATKRYATAARFCADAFAADPQLADDLKPGRRYNAACCAALAAAGQGTDAPQPGDKERARLRKQALGWLRADLALWRKQSGSAKAEDRDAARQSLRHWQQGPDLAGVRGEGALAKLPAEERAEWQKLWADVAYRLWRLDPGKPATAPAGR
jgi:hypothetical protein